MEEIEQVPNTYYYEKIYDDKQVQALYAEYWEVKNRLAACETIAEVEAITWQEAGK